MAMVHENGSTTELKGSSPLISHIDCLPPAQKSPDPRMQYLRNRVMPTYQWLKKTRPLKGKTHHHTTARRRQVPAQVVRGIRLSWNDQANQNQWSRMRHIRPRRWSLRMIKSLLKAHPEAHAQCPAGVRRRFRRTKTFCR